MEQPELRDPYTEVGNRRDRGDTIDRIHREVGARLGISRTEVGRLARRWTLENEERKKLMQLVDWGSLTDVDWKGLPHGVPVEAVPFLLRVGWHNLTVAEAQFCWKMKQAAPDIPVDHAVRLLSLFKGRFPLEFRGEEVDNSDIWAYLASHRWGGRGEDFHYLAGVVNQWWAPLHPTPPNRRGAEWTELALLAYKRLEMIIFLEIDPLDSRWSRHWNRLWKVRTSHGLEDIYLKFTWLPWTPWDPRYILHQDGVESNKRDNQNRVEAQLEEQEAEESDQPAENEGGDES